MKEYTIKVACSVIDGWTHYKGNNLYANDQKLIIKGLYQCEIMLSSVYIFYCKNYKIFTDIHLIMFNRREELTIRVLNSKRGKAVISIIEKNVRKSIEQ